MDILKRFRWSKKGSFEYRRYRSYEAYKRHQGQKANGLDLSDYETTFIPALSSRLPNVKDLTVLCLGARSGAEVSAFLGRGAIARGVDLNPKNSQLVSLGDFHNRQAKAKSLDIVYMNCFDHVRWPEKVIDAILAVLKPRGLFLLEAPKGINEGFKPGPYESFSWDSLDSLRSLFLPSPFELEGYMNFSVPWNGVQLRLRSIT